VNKIKYIADYIASLPLGTVRLKLKAGRQGAFMKSQAPMSGRLVEAT
jgi:hypothetical protein